MGRWSAVAVLVPVLALGGCAGPSTGPGDPGPTEVVEPPAATARPAPTELPLPDPPDPAPAPPGPAPSDLTEAAVLDLAEHLGIPREAVSVVRVEEVTWPDGSLGCPEPGQVYTQVVTDGTLIELAAGGATFRYHAGEGRAPFRCESRQVPHPADG